MTQIVFLLSLPRSGSTHLQRLLAGHPDIATAPEPWIQLPIIGALRRSETWALHGHPTAVRALEDYGERTDSDMHGIRSRFCDVARQTYEVIAARESASVFLDKTPRYTLIASELAAAYPDAKFLILWRNPIDIVQSMIRTWGGDRWAIDAFYVDLYTGLERLLAFSRRHAACCIQYERLRENPGSELAQIFHYLGVDDATELDPARGQRLVSGGTLGDPVTLKGGEYQGGRSSVFSCSPARRMWMRNYLNNLGAESLTAMGFELDELLDNLRTDHAGPLDLRRTFDDVVRMAKAHAKWRVKRRLTIRADAP